MLFRMNTSSVRAMAARFRQTASKMEVSLASIRQTARSAAWQSQAREDFIQQFELLHTSTLQSAEVLRLMAQAAEQKASQWEAIGNRFNSPWQPMGNVWSRVMSMMSWLWTQIKNAVSTIKLPSVPKYILPGLVTFPIIGGIKTIIPPWEFKPPSWWPFKRNETQDHANNKDLELRFKKEDDESWLDWANRLTKSGVEVSELTEFLHKGIVEGDLGGEDIFSFALSVIQHTSRNEQVATTAEDINLLISLKTVVTSLLKTSSKANPYFALASLVANHEKWTPYTDGFSEWVSVEVLPHVFNGLEKGIISSLDIIDIVTLQMDKIIYPNLVTVERQSKANDFFQTFSDLFRRSP